jgi:hypothetical protein
MIVLFLLLLTVSFSLALDHIGSTIPSESLPSLTEYPGSVYDPYPVTDEDYFPCVIYDKNKFLLTGHSATYYRMWHQAPNGSIAMSISNDGIHWTGLQLTDLPEFGSYHISVVYDPYRFGGGNFTYKAWYWIGYPTYDTSGIQFAESNNGVHWINNQAITQYGSLVVDGITPGFFYHLYGPGTVLYNDNSTSIAGQPLSYPYAMYYDIASEQLGPSTGYEAIALAYSADGLNWTRYDFTPVLIHTGSGLTMQTYSYGWDDSHHFRPSVVRDRTGLWHMFYSGSNINYMDGLVYAHGIGHAVSVEGITWVKDSSINPLLYYKNGVAWRAGRTYAPTVVYMAGSLCEDHDHWKIWFSGGSDGNYGINQGIGYAYI